LIDRKRVKSGILNMLKVNIGVKSGEKLLVLTDVPTPQEWQLKSVEDLSDALKRSLLAKTVYEVAKENYPDCEAQFFVYPSVGRHSAYPGKEVEERMKAANVVIAINTYSLSHTDARMEACKVGARVASMPTFLPEMFYPNGPMSVDYYKVATETERIAKLLADAKEVEVHNAAGTKLRFSLSNREIHVDTGILTKPGAFGNLPAGEVYVAPMEGTGNGKIVVGKGWHPNLRRMMTIFFKDGYVTEIVGGGDVGDHLRRLLNVEEAKEPYKSRRNLAEFGIGTNPRAKRPDNILEAEKIKGTIHIAIGDNAHFGGKVSADLHQDFVLSNPDVLLDGKLVIKKGKLRI